MGHMPIQTKGCPICGTPLAIIVDMDTVAAVAASYIGQWHLQQDLASKDTNQWPQVLFNLASGVQLPGYIVRWEHGPLTSTLHVEQVYPERMDYTLSPDQFEAMLVTLQIVHRCPSDTPLPDQERSEPGDHEDSASPW